MYVNKVYINILSSKKKIKINKSSLNNFFLIYKRDTQLYKVIIFVNVFQITILINFIIQTLYNQ